MSFEQGLMNAKKRLLFPENFFPILFSVNQFI